MRRTRLASRASSLASRASTPSPVAALVRRLSVIRGTAPGALSHLLYTVTVGMPPQPRLSSTSSVTASWRALSGSDASHTRTSTSA